MTLSRRATWLLLVVFAAAIVAAELGLLPSGPDATWADWAR